MEGDSLVGNPALDALCQASPVDFVAIKQMVLAAYASETGRSSDDLRAVASWLRSAEQNNPNFRLPHVLRSIATWLMYPSVADKLGQLAHRPCVICAPFETVATLDFNLPADPVSLHNRSHAAYKSAIRAYLAQGHHDFSDVYDAQQCVALTFAISPGSKLLRDVDNMAKSVLDGLEGYAYANDRQIAHLGFASACYAHVGCIRDGPAGGHRGRRSCGRHPT